jgi:HK97 family phage portal protein
MQLFQRAFERRDATFTLKDPSIQALRDAFGLGNTASGVAVNQNTAEALPIVWRCVTIISDTIATMPIKLMRRTERGKVPATDHPLYSILHDLSNPLTTAHNLKATLQRQLCLWGNAYAMIDRYPQGDIKALWPLESSKMRVDYDKQGRLVYEYGHNDTWTFDARRPPIFHLHVYDTDGIHGRSPITVLRESCGEALAARTFASAFWANSAQPAGLLLYPGKLKDTAKQHVRESWQERFGGAKNSGKTAILEEGIKYQQLTMPLDDAQFLESRTFQAFELSLLYGMPPFLLNQTDKATSWGTGLEQQMRGFAAITLAPWQNLWKQSIALFLLTFKSFETHEAVFVNNALVQGDIQTRMNAYGAQIKWGILSPNEARELEDMNPREGGDEYVTPTASTSVAVEPVGA